MQHNNVRSVYGAVFRHARAVARAGILCQTRAQVEHQVYPLLLNLPIGLEGEGWNALGPGVIPELKLLSEAEQDEHANK
jgi:hypothetical protein